MTGRVYIMPKRLLKPIASTIDVNQVFALYLILFGLLHRKNADPSPDYSTYPVK